MRAIPSFRDRTVVVWDVDVEPPAPLPGVSRAQAAAATASVVRGELEALTSAAKRLLEFYKDFKESPP